MATFTYHFDAGQEFPERAFPSVKTFSTYKQAVRAAYHKRAELARIDGRLKVATPVIVRDNGTEYRPG